MSKNTVFIIKVLLINAIAIIILAAIICSMTSCGHDGGVEYNDGIVYSYYVNGNTNVYYTLPGVEGWIKDFATEHTPLNVPIYRYSMNEFPSFIPMIYSEKEAVTRIYHYGYLCSSTNEAATAISCIPRSRIDNL